ncbi:hypothetical protein, partial [Klebsiella pneumoniae]|uniref:hypothetical protein n=1 Tax=Klebsiella pneumoniae TaxID=573 RepID=UPI001953F109
VAAPGLNSGLGGWFDLSWPASPGVDIRRRSERLLVRIAAAPVTADAPVRQAGMEGGASCAKAMKEGRRHPEP